MMDCTMRALCDCGAGINLSRTAEVPGRFKLLMMADSFSVICRVWVRDHRRIEVNFS
jgi:hypothetical protein